MCPPSIAMRPRNTGDIALSVSSPLARPKQAAATALAREIGGVRHDAPSVRHMVIKSPLGSTTETLMLAPICSTLAFAAARICSASARVNDAIGFLLLHASCQRLRVVYTPEWGLIIHGPDSIFDTILRLHRGRQ